MLDWAQARALLEMAGIEAGRETTDGLLCLEAGALEELSGATAARS